MKDRPPRDTQIMIRAHQLLRDIPYLAVRSGVALSVAYNAARASSYCCAVCLGPALNVVLYPRSRPVAILCSYCAAAVQKCNGGADKLRRHSRFNPKLKSNGGRFDRLTMLDRGGRVENPFDLPGTLAGYVLCTRCQREFWTENAVTRPTTCPSCPIADTPQPLASSLAALHSAVADEGS